MSADVAQSDLTNKLGVAATCFLIYDTLIHLDDEVEYVWTRRWSWTQWAYLFLRHFPYLAQSMLCLMVFRVYDGFFWNKDQCRSWLIYQLLVNEVLTVVVEAVLIVRIYAMFNRSIIVISIVLALFAAEITAMVAVLSLSIPKIEFSGRMDCMIINTPAIFSTYWLYSLIFETILFSLTLVKFCTSIKGVFWRRTILYVLVRDGTWAFGMIFMVMLTNTLMYRLIHNSLAGLFFVWELTVMSFAGSHILLNLQRLARPNSFPTSYFDTDRSITLQFTSTTNDIPEVNADSNEHGQTMFIELDTLR